VGHREYGIFYATQRGDAPHPDWTHKIVPLSDNALWPYSEGGTFDPTNVTRMRFYGTDWSGTGQDFMDVKNLMITGVPEPSLAAVLGLGLFGLLPVVRRRK
jgi:hypothetical protein